MHIPVLQKEVLEYFQPKPNEHFIDATFGEGGHSKALKEKKAKILAIERDPELHKKGKGKGIVLVRDSYINIEEIVQAHDFRPISGILFDLGLCSWHLKESQRGFSFLGKEPLDMRFNPEETELTAEKIINSWPEKEIERILKEYGEEQYAKRISQKIVLKRPIKDTLQLAEIIQKTNSPQKTFQALRIAVNKELHHLENVLPKALKILKPGGRLVVISFHSLEDRIIKNFFKQKSKEGLLIILTKKPVTPSEEEKRLNPRSRSAKLRAAQKII